MTAAELAQAPAAESPRTPQGPETAVADAPSTPVAACPQEIAPEGHGGVSPDDRLESTASAHPKMMKKPQNPTFAYIAANYASLKARDDVKTSRDASVVGAREFKALPEAERAKWVAEYEAAQKAYKVWQASDEGKRAMVAKEEAEKQKKLAAQQKKETQKRREVEQQLREAKKELASRTQECETAKHALAQLPKGPPEPVPPSALYFQDHKAKLKQDFPKSHDLKGRAAKAFKELPAEEQAPYQKVYEEARAAFNQWRAGEGGAAAVAAAEQLKHAQAAVQGATAKVRELEAGLSGGKLSLGATRATSTVETPEKERQEKSSTAERKRKEGTQPNAKPAKKVRAAGNAPPAIDEAVLEEARALKYDGLLLNLAERPAVAACGKTHRELLEALKASEGLVNAAQRALLGL